MPPTLQSLLAFGRDDHLAISAPARVPLTFAGLRSLINDTLSSLNAWGIGRNDRVAIVLGNGPEMAACWLACASGTTTAPLNAAYRADEFEFTLRDLNARLLIVEQGSVSPVIAAALRLGVRIVDLVVAEHAPAGQFTLVLRESRIAAAEAAATSAGGGTSRAHDIGMVLHTSGTTSRPKIVPLSVDNLCASAANIVRTLQFQPGDIGLNVMPLFHIHGLIAGVLAPLSAGSQVFCTPGFNALKFFGWMDEAQPTWFTAVPTMHQAIAMRARHHRDVIARHPLRFIRSSSAAMPPQVIHEIESLFGAPLIEAYGMTEAAHQMTSNPLPPHRRKPGTVGVPSGVEVTIVREDGTPLGAGEPGEIVVRGCNLTAGYENNPTANAETFTETGLRTGDLGTIDADGYLRITGRVKEIINRGGEKVSPREIDEILLNHPAVAQALCFAMPHPLLGEEVAAALVLKVGTSTTEREIQAFMGEHVAPYKVPKSIFLMDEIPTGATGKLQRVGLAQRLGLG